MRWGCYGGVKCQDRDVVPLMDQCADSRKRRAVNDECVAVVTYAISLQLFLSMPPLFAHNSFGRPLHDLGASVTGSPNAPAQVK
jgi:hypothetical protein